MAFDRQQHYLPILNYLEDGTMLYIDISTHFLLEKDNKVPSCDEADKRAATQRRSTVARSAQRSTRLEITLHRRARRVAPLHALLHPLCMHFVSWCGVSRPPLVRLGPLL